MASEPRYLIDTNVLLRLSKRDDPSQASRSYTRKMFAIEQAGAVPPPALPGESPRI